MPKWGGAVGRWACGVGSGLELGSEVGSEWSGREIGRPGINQPSVLCMAPAVVAVRAYTIGCNWKRPSEGDLLSTPVR